MTISSLPRSQDLFFGKPIANGSHTHLILDESNAIEFYNRTFTLILQV